MYESSSSSLLTWMQFIKNHTPSLPRWGSVGRFAVVKMTSGYLAVFFISIGRMPFLALTLDNADRLSTLVITPGFYLHYVDVADHDQLAAVYEQTSIYQLFLQLQGIICIVRMFCSSYLLTGDYCSWCSKRILSGYIEFTRSMLVLRLSWKWCWFCSIETWFFPFSTQSQH